MIGGLLSNTSTPTPITLPKGISVTNLLANLPAGCTGKMIPNSTAIDPDGEIKCENLKLDGTSDFTADIVITKKPDDAIPATVLDTPMTSSNFFYSACRQMTIILTPTGTGRSPVSSTVAVADPRYVETLRFPDKGNITVAPSCGANSVAQDANLPTAIDYLNTLATQAKAVKQSLDANKSSGAKPATTSAH
jgi:hypothetical protein